MRTIKFRGRRLDAPLVYGDLIHYLNGAVDIQIAEGGKYRVDPKSVGQFTEFLDKDGAEVYEGDTLELDYVGAAKVIGDGSYLLESVKQFVRRWTNGKPD